MPDGGYVGDDGPAIYAKLHHPTGVSVDTSGNIYIADSWNNCIRKVDASTGVITTVAGNGSYGYSGDGGSATSASLHNTSGVFVDSSGNIFIADQGNNRIRKVSATTGVPPTAFFTWRTDATTDYHVLYNASASTCPSGATCTYSWSTGESGIIASHFFTSTATTTVTLTVTATPGGSSTYSASVAPAYVASNPTAISISSAPFSGYTVTANYNVSGGIAPYTVKARWSDGYSATMTQLSSGAGSQGHAYISAGTYTVTIIATDSGVNGVSKTTAYAATNVTLAPAPTARFTWKTDAITDYLVLYDASASTCPSGATCTYSWSTGENGIIASHFFTSTAPTMVTLILTASPGGSSTYSASVTPAYVASNPTAVSISSVPVSGYTVTANYNVSGGIAPYTVKARWSDGYSATMTQLSPGAGSQGHAYISAGTYTVTIIATDSGVNGVSKTTAYATTNVTLASMSISGIVTDSTGTPLSGVSLNLKLGTVSKKLSTTAADGSYTFTNVVPGSYTIAASKTGYTFYSPAASPVVSDSSVTANIFAKPASINVTGLVTSSTGTPLSGVSMYLKLNGVRKKLVSTNTSGNYTFTNVADGTYTVVAVKSGYSLPTPVPSVTVSGSSLSVGTISSITP